MRGPKACGLLDVHELGFLTLRDPSGYSDLLAEHALVYYDESLLWV